LLNNACSLTASQTTHAQQADRINRIVDSTSPKNPENCYHFETTYH
jgi:hypothetical protein